MSSPGGLVSALTPILRGRPTCWIGWSGAAGGPRDCFQHDGIRNRPITLTREEVRSYYEGFCNRALWPLFHNAIRAPEFHRPWWEPYVEVNRRYARAAAEVVAEDGIVWVHDYHLMLVPRMLRVLRPDVRIGFFLHIPFPPQELFAQLPWRAALLEGVLGADVIGFQTRLDAGNFIDLCRRHTQARREGAVVHYEGRSVRIGAFPISIDFERYERAATSSEVKEYMAEYRRRLGPDRRILLGVDRLDYTKGIDVRLRAFRELLQSGRVDPKRVALLQVAVPTRERVREYREIRADIEHRVGEINGDFGDLGLAPVHYLHRSLPLGRLVALYRLADAMVVTPYCDGMNLVAKEYCAARVEQTGALVLSEFTGAAQELRQALQVNPYDIDGLAQAMETALRMDPGEQRRRMQAMRRTIRQHDVFAWARDFFAVLEER